MPHVVNSVPEPWRPFMDGQLWEFTEEEIRQIPDWRPMINYVDACEPMGMRKIVWAVGGKYYVRFWDSQLHPDWSPSKLAGWE
jgi:hypothetical protein